jgi:type I restriction-modification system DNA methylase subunit
MDDRNKGFIENLQKLDFQIKNQESSSVYFLSELENYIAQGNVSPYIIIALDKAKLFEADAVYFRFFDDNRPPLPQIYLYDNTNELRLSEYYAEKHRAIWSSCEVATFFVVGKTTIKIYDSRKPVEIDNGGNISSKPIDCIDLLSEINDVIVQYKAQNFDNGSFWENQTSKKHFLSSKIASERLVKGLKEIRNKLHKNSSLSIKLTDRLLIICILIKYLEETGLNYASTFFKTATGYEKLVDIISNNRLSSLLSALATHFNGGIFYLDADSKQELDNSDISILSKFFEAGYRNNLFGWKEYSFEHIPVELISNFYEEFIPKTGDNNKKSTGAVYTPSFLVNLLIDECIPLDSNMDENVKLIDPACGSGIFLVSAYKRLVQRWRISNRIQNQLADTTPQKLKDILTNNIFGVDTNPVSVNLSVFSLQLTLCSMLTPKQIWTELQFSDLQGDGNIVQKDFFEYLIDAKNDFDLVIGNPPFNRKELDGKSYEYYQELLQKKFPIKFKNPQKEFAFLFLEKSMHLLEEKKGKLCLILPSGPLLYTEDSLCLRKQIFSTYNISQIIDFTFLRRVLFQATVTSLAIFAEYSNPSVSPVLHITAKRTKQSKERFYFEFDHYDFYNIPKNLVADKINIWKCDLLGGDRVCDIVDKLQNLTPKLSKWCESNDITIYDNVDGNDLFSEEEKANEISLFKEEQLVTSKRQNYWGIKKNITKGGFPTEVTIGDFKKENFDGIEFKGEPDNLELLKEYFRKNSDVICFYIAAISGRQGIRSLYVFEISDLKNFPYIDDLDSSLTKADKIIINDVVKYTLEEFGQGEKSSINSVASKNNLINFSQTYCDILNLYYLSEGKSYKLINLLAGDAYYICELQHTDKDIPPITINPANKNLNALLSEWNPSESAKINKIIRYYDNENKIIRIIKPKQLRFWLESKALRDADETFNDILTY